ncbi:MAG TPA: MFS transporter, partial [Acidimicrobiales bacterium]|nr:MFS transporter [Acidimicrobiales bacterium]
MSSTVTSAVGARAERRSPEAATELRRPHLGLAVICFILFLTFLDNTVISATLANVQSSLQASVTQLQWVVSGYALTFASLMLMAGTLGDLFGRRR